MQTLAPYAVQESNSKGRLYPVADAFDRDPFERDRTRILHSSAFRRLQYKTQVFENSNGDNFRTRLTHSLEVAQVARSVAKALDLNEALAETLALAHDLGHAPFGHRGQDVLDELMKNHGGFEHNFQTLRIGMELESPYPNHEGLNLTYETLEGMLKHCSDRRAREMSESDNPFLASLGQRFLDRKSPSLESQVVDWSDAIAYLHADMEDAINMGILDAQEVAKLSPKFALFWAKAQALNPMNEENDPSVIHQAIRNMMSASIKDLINTSKEAILASGVQNVEDVRNHPELIQFSPSEKREHLTLKKVSRQLIYDHPTLTSQRNGQEDALKKLFAAYEQHPDAIQGFHPADPRGKLRQAADAIASLTDRGVERELNRLSKLVNDMSDKTAKKPRP
jgi:dGTPase